MTNEQKNMLIDKVIDHFGIDDAEYILINYPLTGPGGLRRMLGEIYPEYFCRAYLADQFDREFAEYSLTILYTLKRVVESKSREKQVIIAPREHGKSTFSSFAMPTWAALYEKKKFIFFISSNGDISANFLEKTKKALESQVIVEDFGLQKGRSWNAEEICLKNGVWICCSGWKSGLRGINKDSRPDLIICHEKGTQILHDDKWINVENHPSFKKSYITDGVTVDVFGIPFTETVTKEHRYWTREILPKHTNVKINGLISEGWIEAQYLAKNHYIGYKIDCEVRPLQQIEFYKPGIIAERNKKGRIVKSFNGYEYKLPDEFNDAEWWWLFGLWWGDGHISGKHQIGITINNNDNVVYDHLLNVLNKYSIAHTRFDKIGCFQVIFCHSALNRWLRTWKHGNSMKIPPAWVEKIDFNYQKELIKGYLDADGFIDHKNNNVRLTSIYLPGLLCVKRILARLGIAATIQHGKEKHIETFYNGKTCIAQKKYDLRFRRNASLLGYNIKDPQRYAFDKVFISDGFLWSKVFEIRPSEKKEFCPITAESHAYHTHFGMSHNCDDLEDKNVMESESLRQKLQTCFNEEIGRLGTYNTDFFYIGTLLSEDSLLAKVTKMPAWNSLVLKRVISFPENEQLWEDWRKIYRNIANENRFDDAWNFYQQHKEEMTKGTKVLWEDKVPAEKTMYPGGYYNVMLDRESFGEDAFYKEDQSEPRNSSDMPFKVQRYWQSLYDEPPKIEKLKLTIDPSEGKGLDNTSYTLGGSLNGAVIVREGQLKNHKLNAIMEHTAWFISEYPEIDEVIFEENTYKEDGTEQLRKYLVERGFYRKVTGFRSIDNKHNRIIQMEPDMNTGTILFNNLNVEYNNEVLKYHAKAKHDDACDSLHKLWKTLKKPNYYIK